MADITDSINKRDLNLFKQEIEELVRIAIGISNDYGKSDKKIDSYLASYKKLISLFNKKYPNLAFKIKTSLEDVKLLIFLKNEKSPKEIFLSVASKISGLKSIGANQLGSAEIADSDKFSKEIEKIKNNAYLTYFTEDSGSGIIFMSYSEKNKMIELHYDIKSLANEKEPEFKLIAYYALYDKFESGVDLLNECHMFGFASLMDDAEKRDFMDKFNPRFGE